MDKLSKDKLSDDRTREFSEDHILKLWDVKNVYEKMVSRDTDESYFICDGPPFVSGNLHMGHLSISVIKSTLFNYHNMIGKKVFTKLGYDCHGLPIESLVIREQGYKYDSIPDIPIFNLKCSQTIDKYSGLWTPNFKKIGRLANYDDVYMTRDKNYMETCLWAFKQLYEKDLVYIGNKVMAYSYELNTPLSNFEASQNYKDIETKSIYVGFKCDINTYLVAWTTTPWTLPMNMAICVNPSMIYTKFSIEGDDEKKYIIAKDMIKNFITKRQKIIIEEEFTGKDLENKEYETIYGGTGIVLNDNYVTDKGIGTGIIHIAPAFGEDDYRVCENYGMVTNENIDEYCPVDQFGRFTLEDPLLKGKLVFDCNDIIKTVLKDNKVLFGTKLYKHSYPFCDRTDTPLIYRTTKSFFIRVTKLKDRMIELNKLVNWYPSNIGKNFEKWLENAKDWGVSRFRHYGTPIPIWVNDLDQTDMICLGSIEEIMDVGTIHGEKITDITNLHPEILNNVKIIDGEKTYSRVLDIFDCWFESGCSPMAQVHYPFDPASRNIEEKDFLSDFICEGMDQTRGWFYTLLVLSTAIFDKPAYENVMCMGLVLDSNGKKFSKKLGNYCDPMDLVETYGSDIIRSYILRSQLGNGEPLKFNESNISETMKYFIPYYNSIEFFKTYVKVANDIMDHKIVIENINIDLLSNIFDIWFLNRLKQLTNEVRQLVDTYKVNHAMNKLLAFIDDLTNWYIKFNRSRLKGNDGIHEMNVSLNILYHGLMTYTKLLAPFTPFYSDHTYLQLATYSTDMVVKDSVLLEDYPEIDDYDETILDIFDKYREISMASRTLRHTTINHSSLKVPLKKVIICTNDEIIGKLEPNIHCLKDELNCDMITFETIDSSMTYKVTPNLPNIGKEFRGESKKIVKFLSSLEHDFLESAYVNGVIEYDNDSKKIILNSKHYKLSKIPKEETSDNIKSFYCKSGILVKIDHTYDHDINIREQMRILQSTIQQKRNEMELKSWNKIRLLVDSKLKLDITDYVKLENSDIIMDVDFDEKQEEYIEGKIINDEIKTEVLFKHTIKFIGEEFDIHLFIHHTK
jgi:isoleucyl-tRNA synthetase